MDHPLPLPEPSDAELVRAAQAGDRAALETLARRWWPTLRRWALLEMGDPALAEDAVQETLVRLIRHFGTFDPTRPLGPWLHRIVVNCCHDVGRARGVVLEMPTRGEAAEMDLGRPLDIDRLAKRAVEAFVSLAPRQRQVLDLCDRGGAAPDEAAEMLGIAPGTARALLHQARKALRRRLLAHHADILDLLREP